MSARPNTHRPAPARKDRLRPQHVIALLDRSAVAFCHAENPHVAPAFMAETLLRALIRRAEADGIALTFVAGHTELPRSIERLINGTAHIKIVPAARSERGAIVVADSTDAEALQSLTPDGGRNLILRLARRDLGRLQALCAALEGRYGRLSIHLRGIEYFTPADLDLYTEQLDELARYLRKLFSEGRRLEVNVLTDRMMLKEMRNCDAGVTHVTLTPEGDCHICPAFYYGGETPIGRFDARTGFSVRRLANLGRAQGPLCSRCDAFHCKRCVWLNRKLTREDNVPSEQQCAIAHSEREASRHLLQDLGTIEPFWRMPRIAELAYRDPLELINGPH